MKGSIKKTAGTSLIQMTVTKIKWMAKCRLENATRSMKASFHFLNKMNKWKDKILSTVNSLDSSSPQYLKPIVLTLC